MADRPRPRFIRVTRLDRTRSVCHRHRRTETVCQISLRARTRRSRIDLVKIGTCQVVYGCSPASLFLSENTDAGRRELLGRLRHAAGRVCEEYANRNWALGYHRVYSSCFRSSLAAAVDKIQSEQVSALFATTALPNMR